MKISTNRSTRPPASRVSYTTKAAQALFVLSITLLAYQTLLPSSAAQPGSKVLLAASAALWSVATLVYGVDRPHLKLSIATASVFLLRTLAYLFPGAAAAGWQRALMGLLIVILTLAWLRLVVFHRSPQGMFSRGRKRRRDAPHR